MIVFLDSNFALFQLSIIRAERNMQTIYSDRGRDQMAHVILIDQLFSDQITKIVVCKGGDPNGKVEPGLLNIYSKSMHFFVVYSRAIKNYY